VLIADHIFLINNPKDSIYDMKQTNTKRRNIKEENPLTIYFKLLKGRLKLTNKDLLIKGL
jgi:hypothetical protein